MNDVIDFNAIENPDVKKYLALDSLAVKIHETGVVSQEDIISLESVCPGAITDKTPLYCFTVEASATNLNVAIEGINWAKAGVVMAAIAAVIAFIVKLFKGRKGNKNSDKDMRRSKEEAQAAHEEFQEQYEATTQQYQDLTVDEIEYVTQSPDVREQISRVCDLLKMDESYKRKYLKDLNTFFLDMSKNILLVHLTHYVYDKKLNKIIDGPLYIVMQNDLKAAVSAIKGEAGNRVEFLSNILAYGEEQTRVLRANPGIMGKIPDLPYKYRTDVNAISEFLKEKKMMYATSTEVVNAFYKTVVDYFSHVEVPTNHVTSHYLIEHITEDYVELVNIANLYVNEYNEKYINKIEAMQHQLASSRYDDTSTYVEDTKVIISQAIAFLDSIFRTFREEANVMARINASMVIISERGSSTIENLEEIKIRFKRVYKLIIDIANLIRTVPKNQRISNESAFLNESRRLDVVSKQLRTFSDAYMSLEDSGKISRDTARSLANINPELIPENIGLESYSFIPSKVNYRATLESIGSKAKELAGKIYDAIIEMVKKFYNWIKDVITGRKKNKFSEIDTQRIFGRLNQDIRRCFDAVVTSLLAETNSATYLHSMVSGHFSTTDLDKKLFADVGNNVAGLFDLTVSRLPYKLNAITKELSSENSGLAVIHGRIPPVVKDLLDLINASAVQLRESLNNPSSSEISKDTPLLKDFAKLCFSKMALPLSEENIKSIEVDDYSGKAVALRFINSKLIAMWQDKDNENVSISELEGFTNSGFYGKYNTNDTKLFDNVDAVCDKVLDVVRDCQKKSRGAVDSPVATNASFVMDRIFAMRFIMQINEVLDSGYRQNVTALLEAVGMQLRFLSKIYNAATPENNPYMERHQALEVRRLISDLAFAIKVDLSDKYPEFKMNLRD